MNLLSYLMRLGENARKRLQKLHDSTYARFAVLWVAAFAILESFFFASILEADNYLEVFPSEFIFPTCMHIVTALVITLVVYFVRKPRAIGAKLISVIVLSLLMVNYDARFESIVGILRALLPILPKPDNDKPLLSIIFLLLLFACSRWIGMLVEKLQQKYTQLNSANIFGGVSIIIFVMAFGQCVTIGKLLPTLIRESRAEAAELPTPNQLTASNKPDIYYIVLDRYTNDDVLQNQFDYNNTFTSFLRDNGFTINDTARSNYPYTAMSVASTINAQYTNNIVDSFKNNPVQSRTLYHNLIRQSAVVKAFKDAGYTYNAIGSWYGASSKNPLADQDLIWDHLLTISGKHRRLYGIEDTEFLKSPYFRLAQIPALAKVFHVQERTPVEEVRQQLHYLNELANQPQSGGRFIFAHILVPHEPFFFNGDGSLSTTETIDNEGRPIKQKYLGQVEFINSEMQSLVQTIEKQSDGKAIIAFNADEGPYPDVMNTTSLNPTPSTPDGEGGGTTDMTKWPDGWLKMKYGILQAVKIPGASEEDLMHLSSVNLFRIILNTAINYQLSYLPNCTFGLNLGGEREYNYTDITDRFTPIADPKCQTMQSIPAQN